MTGTLDRLQRFAKAYGCKTWVVKLAEFVLCSLLGDTIGEYFVNANQALQCTVWYYTSLKCAYAEVFNSGMFFLFFSINNVNSLV